MEWNEINEIANILFNCSLDFADFDTIETVEDAEYAIAQIAKEIKGIERGCLAVVLGNIAGRYDKYLDWHKRNLPHEE